MMCRIQEQTRSSHYPVEGETVQLGALEGTGRQCAGRFPWWMLWVAWPLFFIVKGSWHLASPLMTWLGEPLVLTVTPLPLLLVAIGIAVLMIDRVRRG
ncbi:hypothetical protein EYB53_019385 [Candidatus Chloroploca sp. M-50]|uniref:Uncharacterized protein n=1 Tax=Candidatus Chloroploca mongolica TaxID=2528176 RepID=A0ABS4DEL9_9CHLR|nr:hypothetical protein [Candidatus Chloroploca mongolica]MBP1467888.1 hypothetical protein [Candidatus Chloroploca mongolica]